VNRRLLFATVTMLGVLSFTSAATAQGAGSASGETKDMQEKNKQFRERESKRPASETDYRNTKQYQKSTPEERKRVDDAQQRNLEALEKLKKGSQ
jgi:hypothetical protein